jgi:PAS domain-containing protein
LRHRLAGSPRGLLTAAVSGVLAVLFVDCLEFAPDILSVAAVVVLLPFWAWTRFTYERGLEQAERDRDRAERQYQELVESLPLVTFVDVADDCATNVYTRPQAVDMLGWSLDDWRDDPHLFLEILWVHDRGTIVETDDGSSRAGS